MRDEMDNPITIEPAPDLGKYKYRAHCEVCTRTFVINFPQNTLVVCPSCGTIKTPEWEDNKSKEEQK